MADLIGFKADKQTKLIAGALASRLGFSNVSEMMRAILEDKINDTYTEDELAHVIDLITPKKISEPKVEYETKPPKAARKR